MAKMADINGTVFTSEMLEILETGARSGTVLGETMQEAGHGIKTPVEP